MNIEVRLENFVLVIVCVTLACNHDCKYERVV